jgi:SAM-dependent methyltransferase
VLDIGCGQGYVSTELARKAKHVVGVDQYVRQSDDPRIEFKVWDIDTGVFPVPVEEFDQIFILDVIEHLHDPEAFMEQLRDASVTRRPELIMTTGNIGFFITRFMLLLGNFNYGRKGILDRTHTRLFTFASFRELLDQTGYTTLEMRGIPAPFAKALGHNVCSRVLASVNTFLIGFLPGLFSYQMFVRARALPTVKNLLSETITSSEKLRQAELAAG